MKKEPQILLSIILALAPIECVAQSARDFSASFNRYVEENAQGTIIDQGALIVESNATPNLARIRWARYFPAQNPKPDLEIDAPFHRVGGAQKLATREYLVCGGRIDNGHAVLCRVRLVTGATEQIDIVETRSFPAMDFISVAFNATESRLYALDLTGKRLVYGSWQPSAPSLPSSLSTAVSHSELSVLSRTNAKLSTEFLPNDDPAGVLLYPFLNSGRTKLRIKLVGQAWVWSSESGGGVSGPTWWVDFARPMLTTKVRLMAATTGGAFVIQNLIEGISVAQGQLSGPDDTVEIPSPQSFFDFPGEPHTVVGAGASNSPVFWPVLRYGQPMPTAQLTVYPGLLTAASSYRGNNNFAPGDRIWSAQPVAAGVSISTRLIVAVRSTGGSDPVIDLGQGHFLLNSINHIDFDVTFQEGQIMGSATQHVPIPNDPLLDGVTVLYQFAYVDSAGALALSDVLASSVQPPPGSGSTITAGRLLSAEASALAKKARADRKRAASSQAAVDAAQRWLTTITTTKHDRLQALLQKLGSQK